MATLIDFRNGESPVLRDTFSQRVYLKSAWSDAWIEYPYLFALEVAWSTAPTLPTATLQWLYGEIKQYDDDAFALFLKSTTIMRAFVKVEYVGGLNGSGSGGASRTWIGLIELIDDQHGASMPMAPGSTDSVATGAQVFTAYGLEKLLYDHQVIDAVTNAGDERTQVPPIFNRDGEGNRTAAKSGDSYIFDDDPDGSNWATADIVEYLLTQQTPRDEAGTVLVGFELDSGLTLPDWDTPIIEQEGQTTYEIIDRLLNRRRLSTWSVYVDETAAPAKAVVRVHSLLDTALSLPAAGASDIPANDRQLHLDYDDDPLTSAALQTSGVELVDQVIVRGARRRSVGSFSVPDETLEAGWTSGDESTYVSGSTQASGGTRPEAELHREARARPKLSHVYRFFRIPYGWNRKVKDGEGGTENPLFPIPDSAESFPVFYPDMWIEQTMPLYEGVDYKDEVIADGAISIDEIELQEAPPWVFVRPKVEGGGGRWKVATDVGQSSDLEVLEPHDFARWSISVRVPPKSQGMYLDVHGAPQHVLYADSFSYLDKDIRLGKFDYSTSEANMIVTLSVPDDRYCEGRWPETVGSGSASGDDAIRRKLIWAGDGYRKDYVAPGTVVGVDDGGDLERSTGGYIPKEGTDDDETKLVSAAKVAAMWYTVERYVLTLETYRLMDDDTIRVGDLVVDVGDASDAGGHRQSIDTVVTEIRISSQMGTPANQPPAKMTVTTGMGQLDPFGVLPDSTSGYVAPSAIDSSTVGASPVSPGDRYAPGGAFNQ